MAINKNSSDWVLMDLRTYGNHMLISPQTKVKRRSSDELWKDNVSWGCVKTMIRAKVMQSNLLWELLK